MAVTYSGTFFDEMEETNLASARAVLPHLFRLLRPASVVDVGCGRGLWLKAFAEAGVGEYLGIDGSYVEKESLSIPEKNFQTHDLEQPIALERAFDLAVCLEVAEHLPAHASDTLVETLTNAAPVILFSAAIPLQGGSHHVNEQWPAYWEEKFKRRGFVPVDALRRHIWQERNVSFFYAQNILLYVKESELDSYPKLQEEIESGHGSALPLVHPHMYSYYAERWRMVVPFLGKFPPSFLHRIKKLLALWLR
jgi:SAM-dependent methyltransferase